MSKVTLRGFVDRIEGPDAVVLVGDDAAEVRWPRKKLPDGAGEGSVLSISLTIDEEATRDAGRTIDSLIDRLRRGD